MPLLPLSSTDHTLSDTPLLLFLLYILCTLSSLYALSTLDSFNWARTDHSCSLFPIFNTMDPIVRIFRSISVLTGIDQVFTDSTIDH